MVTTKRTKSIETKQVLSLGTWKDDHFQYKGTVTFGMHYIYGNSNPYFFITGETYRRENDKERWTEDSCGCIHDLIVERKPELKALLSFHGRGQDGTPKCYIANTIYFYECYRNEYRVFKNSEPEQYSDTDKEKYRSYFCENTLLDLSFDVDSLKLEASKTILDLEADGLKLWLEARLPYLQEKFLENMTKFNVELIEIID